MKKKIIISVTAVGLVLAVIGKSVGTYMSYINKYVPIASPTALSYKKSDSQKELVTNADFYVSVNGDDGFGGSLKNPFKTIKKAQEAVREVLAKKGNSKTSITVAIMAGTYYETDILFDERDYSKNTSAIYTAYGDGEVILCGGKILTLADFSSVDSETAKRLSSQAADKVKMIDLKKLGLKTEDYGKVKATGGFNTEEYYDNAATENSCELFFDSKRMSVARYPNNSYITVGKVSDIGDCYEPNAPAPADKSWLERRNQRGGTFALDNDTYERIKSWQNTKDLWAFGYFYWDWADMSTPIKSINNDKTITTEYCSKYGFKDSGYYYFFNVLEELDAPNEYYIDRDNGILYFYPPDENDDSKIMLSTSNKSIINITEKASNVTISDITMQGTRCDAVMVAGENCKILNCTIKNAAQCGISVSGRNNLVENCEVAFIGKDAVLLSGGNKDGFVHGNNTVTNNSLHDYGEIQKTYIAGVNLSGIGNTVSHNEIYNAPHMGIYYKGNENVMEYNYIHDVVLQSSDAGAIYTGYSFSTYGNILRYNCISNIGSGDFTPSGIYFDDNSSGQKAYGNVLINIPGYALLIGGGRDNMIENNLIINSEKQINYDARAYDGYHNDGWYAKNCKAPDSRLWQLMDEAKEFNTSIGNKYDGIERMHQDYERVEDEGFAVNPSGSSLKNNIIVSKQNKIGTIAKAVKKYSVVENNHTFTLNSAKSSFEDYENGDYRIKADSKISKKCPDFKENHFNEIGRK
ncbi:MAG: right-handed parallel beta-helix repeat-containing protein [Oscillospiraceae bacterium]